MDGCTRGQPSIVGGEGSTATCHDNSCEGGRVGEPRLESPGAPRAARHEPRSWSAGLIRPPSAQRVELAVGGSASLGRPGPRRGARSVRSAGSRSPVPKITLLAPAAILVYCRSVDAALSTGRSSGLAAYMQPHYRAAGPSGTPTALRHDSATTAARDGPGPGEERRGDSRAERRPARLAAASSTGG
jgi:hypothetical protein